MIVRFLIPLVYCLIMGIGWSSLFKKKFYDSLAPAFIAHSLFVIIVGLLTEKLSIGIYLGICVMVIANVVVAIRRKIAFNKESITAAFKHQTRNGVAMFLVLFVTVFLFNTGKCFLAWDEFSHWGVFLKESLRLDNFYATSNLNFAHKDYVPAFTIFEVIYCKISGGFTRPQAYRAIQILGFALMLPMFGRIIDYCTERKNILRNLVLLSGSVLLVLMTPFVYNNDNGFQFYHTIYCDYILGILFFYLLYVAYQKHENVWYKSLLLTMGISMFVLAKMTAMALFPMVIVLLMAIRVVLGNASKRNIITYIPQLLVPMGLWAWFNSFVHKYVETDGNIQSYGSIKLSSILDVFGSAENNSITYIETLRRNYLTAVFTRDIWIRGSYVVILLILVAVIASMAFYVTDINEKKKISIVAIWTFIFGIAYALLMYFLYATSFTEDEAIGLASYERYMNTFIVAVVLLAIAVYYESGLWKNNGKTLFGLVLSLFIFVFVFNISYATQAFPVVLTHENEYVQSAEQEAQLIMANTDDGSSVFIVKRGDSGFVRYQMTFYCDNRIIGGYSAGTPVSDSDIYSEEVSVEQFVQDVSSFEYIYFSNVDDAFISLYSDAFEDPSLIFNAGIYKVEIVDGKISLQ